MSKAIGGIDADRSSHARTIRCRPNWIADHEADLRVDYAGRSSERSEAETFGPLGRRRSSCDDSRHKARHGKLVYDLRRVCAAWAMGRSSFQVMPSGQHAEPPPAKRRVPKPAISDQALLVAIAADQVAAPWEGEGYRKVWPSA